MDTHARPEEPGAGGSPPRKHGLRILAVFLALYGAYSLWWAIHGWYWSGGFSAVVSMVAAAGLWLGYPWSRYFVYLFAAMVCLYFAGTIWALVRLGWPYPDKAESVAAVVPGSVILMLAVAAGIYVFRAYRS